MQRSATRRIGNAAVAAPRLLMSWEDWLTFAAAVIVFLSVAVSIQQANWVRDMPAIVPTVIAGLLVGLFAARIRFSAVVLQPVAIALGLVVVILAAQSFADGDTFSERLADFRLRMDEWFTVVRAGDISNDDLPFVTLVHAVSWLAAYLGAWSIYRWHNAWLALVPGGVVLLANISFLKGHPSGAFVIFTFGAIMLISRLHIQKSQARWKRQGVEYPDWMSLSAMNFTLILTVVLIVTAWRIPLGTQAAVVEGVFDRVVSPVTNKSENMVRLFHNIDSRKGARLHTFGSTLPIQGNVKLGTKALLEVNSGDGGLIRATSYDEYTGNGWKTGDRDVQRVDSRVIVGADDPNEAYKGRTTTILQVKVLDAESTILSSGIYLSSNLNSTVETPKGFAADVERVRSRRGLDKNDTYSSVGSESKATAEALSAAGTDYPEWVRERYLQLPKNLPTRVGEEARTVVGPASGPYNQALAIQDYLRSFPYDLTVESPPAGRDTVDFLLFDLKRGYFDYQATAMAVMLRTLGIPSRVAVGYVLDPSEAEETKYLVRKDDAYTWVEVFFPGYGWVSFNPTQDKPAGGAGGIGTINPGNGLEELPPEDPLGVIGQDIELPADAAAALGETATDARHIPWQLLAILGAVLTVFALLGVSGRVAWNWGLGSLDGRAQLWAKTQRLSSWGGLGARAAETPREWSRRMGSAVALEDEAVSLAKAFEESRYGRPDLQRIDDEEATGAYKRLRGALASYVVNRGRRKKLTEEKKAK
jgi:transglutaminase-like putative cysteine protease